MKQKKGHEISNTDVWNAALIVRKAEAKTFLISKLLEATVTTFK